MQHLEFGLDTFGDVPEDDSGTPVSYARAIRQVFDVLVWEIDRDPGVPQPVKGLGQPSRAGCR